MTVKRKAMNANNLPVRSTAAQLLLRIHLGQGYCAGPRFPGDTIRRGLVTLERIGLLDNQLHVTTKGRDYCDANHLNIPSA